MFLRRRLPFTLLALIACFSILLTAAYAWNGVRLSGTDASTTVACVDYAAQGDDAAAADCQADDNTTGMDDVLEGLSLNPPALASKHATRTHLVVRWRDATIARLSPPPDV